MKLHLVNTEEDKVDACTKDDQEREEPHEEGDQGVGLFLLWEGTHYRVDEFMSLSNVQS